MSRLPIFRDAGKRALSRKQCLVCVVFCCLLNVPVPQSPLGNVHWHSGLCHVRAECLAEGVQVETTAQGILRLNPGLEQVFPQRFNLRYVPEKGPCRRMPVLRTKGAEFLQDGRGNLDDIRLAVLAHRRLDDDHRTLNVQFDVVPGQLIGFVAPQSRVIEYPVNEGPHVGSRLEKLA
ncbi:MAG TPA: hypothetical protein VK737_03350 [Opitutales bacterium]|nr:hypothetical protein [Opitutales bacterium]